MIVTCVHPDRLAAADFAGRPRCLLLDSDFLLLQSLRRRFPEQTIEDVGDCFHPRVAALRDDIARLFAALGDRHNAPWWWGGQLASRSSTAVPAVLDMVYLALADEALAGGGDLLFVTRSHGLAEAIVRAARQRGHRAFCRGLGGWRAKLRTRLGLVRRALQYLAANWRWFRALRQAAVSRRPPPEGSILCRAWVTRDTIKPGEPFVDRNFGDLPAHLAERGYPVVILPMMFNLDLPLVDQLRLMASTDAHFVFPHQWIGWRDVLGILGWERRRLGVSFRGCRLGDLDVEPILRWDRDRGAMAVEMMLFNLGYPLLGRLRLAGCRFAGFLAAFENKGPEKPFVLATRACYPEVPFTGYLHTVWVDNDLAHRLVPEDLANHPLPARIVTPGEAYVNILRQEGFPAERLIAGPALRFAYVARMRPVRRELPTEPTVLFFPLPYDTAISLEVIARVAAALDGAVPFRLLVKPHPLNDAAILRREIEQVGRGAVELVGGTCADWYPRCHAVLACGASVIQMEAIASGVPLIRIAPNAQFFLDPMHWMRYPIAIAYKNNDIIRSVRVAGGMTDFQLAGEAEQLAAYFTEPTAATMNVFTAD